MIVNIKFLHSTLAIAILHICLTQNAYADGGKKVDGFTIDDCQPGIVEGFEESKKSNLTNFCSKSFIQKYKKFSKKDINFNKNLVLIRLGKEDLVALNPQTKQVFVMPYKLVDLTGQNLKKPIHFSKSSNIVCTSDNATGFTHHAGPFYLTPMESSDNYKICIDFDSASGFLDAGTYPVDKKTNKVVSWF